MLVDKAYREWVVRQTSDPMVRSFWTKEFAGYDKHFLAEIIAPVQNKVGQLVMAPPLRNILGQVRSRIDLRFMMDTGRIFIANLAKGRLGEDKANLLGALLVAQFQLAAMSRADVPEQERRDFHLHVDEFHNFTTDSFASMLSEVRKYGLGLVLSHQYTAQLRPEIRDAVFGNVGTLVAFRVGESDAKTLEREFGGGYDAAHLSGLRNFEVIVKSIGGAGSPAPFVGRTLEPLSFGPYHRENLIRRSREKYAARCHVVEDKIRRWSEGKGRW
jgi:hypothetical protein